MVQLQITQIKLIITRIYDDLRRFGTSIINIDILRKIVYFHCTAVLRGEISIDLINNNNRL